MDLPSLTRRQFLRRTGLAASGGALGSLVSLGLEPETLRAATVPLRWKIERTKVVPSICPYCAVGCSILLHVRDGRLVNLEGNPDSPINRGTLCPKGAATRQLVDNPYRWTTVRYRAPYSDRWEERPLDWAMERIARLVKETRDASFEETNERGLAVNRTLAIGHLGGATLDNEENYLIKKLFTAGLGIVAVENQARI